MKRTVVFATVAVVSAVAWHNSTAGSKPVVPLSSRSTVPVEPVQLGLTKWGANLTQLAFTENQGQWHERVRFRADVSGTALWFMADGVCYHFTRRASMADDRRVAMPVAYDRHDRGPDEFVHLVIKKSFVGANPEPRVTGESMMRYECNYFIGNDPAGWYTNVHNYASVVFEDIYPGIDLRYYGRGGRIEYDFIVSRGADISRIEIRYEGARSLAIDETGALVIETDWGPVMELRPNAYQRDGDTVEPIECEYNLSATGSVGFKVPGGYDQSRSLAIVPVITFSMSFGGEDADLGEDIVVGGGRYAYITGFTVSIDFPTVNPVQPFLGGTPDAFVTKVDMAESTLVYSTFLGGDGYDTGKGIGLDNTGAAYLAGYTGSDDFPTAYALQATFGGGNWDAFVAKLSAAGDALLYSTFLGGQERDLGLDVGTDPEGNACVTGLTGSPDFPLSNPLQAEFGGVQDAFFTKIGPGGIAFVYSTYFGGSLGERGEDVTMDSDGNAYFVGMTQSTDFLTQSPLQESNAGGADAYVVKVNPAGDALVYSTYFGGSGADLAYGVAADDLGAVYVAGYTYSLDFPTGNPIQGMHAGGIEDAYVFKLSPDGDVLEYSTYLGGSGSDLGYRVGVDALGCAYVTGGTGSTDFPIQSAIQENLIGSRNAFITKLDPTGSNLVYSTYLYDTGSGILDDCTGISISLDNTVFVTSGGVRIAGIGSYNVCGDADDSGVIDIDDVVHLVSYIFAGGPSPDPVDDGDTDCSGSVDIDDVVCLINFIFSGSLAPCDPDGDGVPDC